MALIGNGALVNRQSCRQIGGGLAGDFTNWNRAERMNRFVGGFSQYFGAYPDGYRHPLSWIMPLKAGALSSNFSVVGAGSVSASNLAGGLYGESTVVGAGDVTSSVISAIGNIVSTNYGSGNLLNSDIVGILNAAADIAGQGNISGTLASLLSASAILVGISSLTGEMISTLPAYSTVTGASNLSASIAGVVLAISQVSGSGTFQSTSVVGGIKGIASLIGAGDVSGALSALAHLESTVIGSGSVVNALPFADGSLSATISASGDVLTAGKIAEAVMGYSVDGSYTFEQVTQIMAAILAGKTTIVNNGDGTATVTFRNLPDSVDRAIFEMDGSERVEATYN